MTEVFLRGDSRYFWPENIGDYAHFPSAWDNALNTGIGQSQVGSLWITSYLNLTSLAERLGMSWEWIQLLFWILPAVIISFLSSYLLFKYLFKDKVKYSLLAGLIYTFNTYFLMILTGGQLGVALSYSMAPLVLVSFIKLVDNLNSRSYNFKFQISNFKLPIIAGLTLGLQIIFDPRIVYVTLVTTFLYSVFNFAKIKRVLKNSLGFFVLPLAVAILMNIFWLLPLLLTKSTPLPQGLGNTHDFKFFSFADFSHAFSLLHPNWPENIFGKVYFLRPEFLILPILAFSSLFFAKNKNILFFSFLALVGAFLAKGASPPFGEVNEWLFQNFPGMVMFRDPTKFYLLIALSYSILIPFSISSISNWLMSKIKKKIFNISYVFLLFTIFYLLFLTSPIFGQMRIQRVPQEYVQLKNFLYKQPEFFRTLWIPKWQRYGFFSNLHPAMGREEIFKGDAKDQIVQFKKNDTQKILTELSIRYIVVPFDSEGEIFLNDRKYDEKKFQNVVGELGEIGWLSRVSGFENIAVFEVPNPKDHFWSPSKTLSVNYKFQTPAEYEVVVSDVKKGDLLVFSEGYDKNWTAISSQVKIPSTKYGNNLNSFLLSQDGEYKIYYKPQKWVNLGLLVSTLTLVSALVLLFGSRLKK